MNRKCLIKILYKEYLINQNFNFATSVFQLQISHGFKNNVELFLQNKCRQRILNLLHIFQKERKRGPKKLLCTSFKRKKIDLANALRIVHVVMSKSKYILF